MADEVNFGFVLPGGDAERLKQWKAQPPAFLADAGFELVDESYDTLVYRSDVTSRAMKVLMLGYAHTLYTLSFTFRPADEGTTRVTALGQAPEASRAALVQYATAHQAR